MTEPAHTTSGPVAGEPPATPITATTQRGLATASFSLGMWGLLVCWWYPFGLALAVVGLVLGVVTVGLGIRGGKDGEHIGLAGIAVSATAIGLSIGLYRFVQLAFEGDLTGGLMQR